MRHIVQLIDLKIFVDTDGDVRLARRLRRDTLHRGRSIQSVLEQYMRFVKPAFEQFIAPCMTRADMIIPWGTRASRLPYPLALLSLLSEDLSGTCPLYTFSSLAIRVFA